jgi:hypothetical protein
LLLSKFLKLFLCFSALVLLHQQKRFSKQAHQVHQRVAFMLQVQLEREELLVGSLQLCGCSTSMVLHLDPLHHGRGRIKTEWAHHALPKRRPHGVVQLIRTGAKRRLVHKLQLVLLLAAWCHELLLVAGH